MINKRNTLTQPSFSIFFTYLFLIILSILWLLPIVWLVINSFRGLPKGAFPQIDLQAIEGEGFTYIINGLKEIFLPKEWTLNNYIRLFTETHLFNFPRWFMNTLIVAVASCAITTMITLATSYAFSRLRFKMRKPFMNIILVLGMFPGFMSMIAIYHILKVIGLDQSLLALVLVYSGGASMGYYISKGFFDTIPVALDESAMIEGVSKSQVFFRITLPLSKPIVVYTILTAFMGPWVDFVFASIIMKDNYNNFTVAIGLFEMLKRENIFEYFTTFCAGAVVVAIPIAAIFIAMQKYYVSGITAGGVKG